MHVSHYGAESAARGKPQGWTTVKINWLDKLPIPFDDHHTMCGGGAYSADAAGTARASQEHRCVPHRTAILLLE